MSTTQPLSLSSHPSRMGERIRKVKVRKLLDCENSVIIEIK